MSRSGRLAVAFAAAILMPAVSACPKRGADAPHKMKVRYGTLPEAWKPASMEGLDAAWYHAELGSTIGLSVVCDDVGDASLHALAQRQLVGIDHREVLAQGTVPVDGRIAEDWVVKGSVDGVELRLNLVVFRRDECVVDMNLIAPPHTFEAARADFRGFVTGFGVVDT